jgi:ParB-like chromosome segregation protein Spo0J
MVTLRLDRITQDKSIQQRIGGLQAARVREYSKAMQNGDRFPPITVFRDHGQKKYWLADGFHRCAAAAAAGFTEIEAEVKTGTERQALLYAAGANADHGIRRTNADKRQAVVTLLEDAEWSRWSDHEIAKRTHTTQPFVSKLRHLTRHSTVRLGADGRRIETANIGKSQLYTLGNAWQKTSAEERSQWVAAHRQELQALLRRTEKQKPKISH